MGILSPTSPPSSLLPLGIVNKQTDLVLGWLYLNKYKAFLGDIVGGVNT